MHNAFNRTSFFVCMKFNKQILKYGTWKHPMAPGGVLRVTENFVKQIIENFDKMPFSPVLRGHVDNEMAEANPSLIVSKNIISLEMKDDGLYATFEADKKDIDSYNDVSAGIAPNYEDHETGEIVGPVLKHIALVLDPYIKGLKTFTKLGDQDTFNILLSDIMDNKKMETPKDQEEEIIIKAEEPSGNEEESPKEESPKTEPKGEETPKDQEEGEEKIEASEKYKQEILKLQEENRKYKLQLTLKDAKTKFSELLKAGKVLPVQEEQFVALCIALEDSSEIVKLSDKEYSQKDILINLFDKGPKRIDLDEKGRNQELGNGGEINLTDDQVLSIKERNKFKTVEETWEYINRNKDIYSKYIQN